MKNELTIESIKPILTNFLVSHIEQVDSDVADGIFSMINTSAPKKPQKEQTISACKHTHYGEDTKQQLGYEYFTMLQEMLQIDASYDPSERSEYLPSMSNFEFNHAFTIFVGDYNVMMELITFIPNELQRLLDLYEKGMELK